MNMIVVVVGYRTYPDGNVNDQVDDVESALNTFHEYCDSVDKKNFCTTIVGHSSGAHLSMLLLLRQYEQEIGILDSSFSFRIDYFIALSGVFSICDHFYYESGRGVEEFSPMKPACGRTRESFVNYSPTEKFKAFNSLSTIVSPRMLFIHGIDDDTVPFTSSKKLIAAMRSTGLDMDCTEHYLTSVDHTEVVIDIMLGGQSRDLIKKWF